MVGVVKRTMNTCDIKMVIEIPEVIIITNTLQNDEVIFWNLALKINQHHYRPLSRQYSSCFYSHYFRKVHRRLLRK